MPTGVITRLFEEKSYGFLRPDPIEGADSGLSKSLFFHKTGCLGRWERYRAGDRVEFEFDNHEGRPQAVHVQPVISDGDGHSLTRQREIRRIDPYTGPTLNLTDQQRLVSLNEIAKWKLEARFDDIGRYFFSIPELSDIIVGEASYVIGRKGTGKTALVQHLSSNTDDDVLATKLTFKSFPFNELYSHSNESYRRPNQYITLWKLIIYSAACRLISQSDSLDPLLRKTIEKAFPPLDSDSLSSIIGKWTSGDFSFQVLGSGVALTNWFKEKKKATLNERVENLERFMLKHAPSERILVMFDELDEDYKEIFDSYKKSDYLDLLTSLFKAIQDVRASMNRRGVRLYPVAFLRDDIYDLIQDPDKSKWRDLEVNLKWTTEEIKALLAHRLSRVFGSQDRDLDVLWHSIFSPEPLTYAGGRKEIRSFEYMRMSAQGRPRDYINYMQECAASELRKSRREIAPETVKQVDKAYSNYLKNELVDEIHGIIPDISKVLSIFSELRKSILNISEFRAAYIERVEAGSMTITDVDMVLRTLFYFPVIGNVVRVGVHVFKHEQPDAQLNFKEQIIVHRGLQKALQIL